MWRIEEQPLKGIHPLDEDTFAVEREVVRYRRREGKHTVKLFES